MHLLTAPLLIANCLVTSVLGQPVPSGTGGGQGPVEPRRGLVAKVFGGLRDLRAHAGHGVRKVPGVADLLYPESMIPGREVYYNLDLLPPTTGDRHSAKYKCVELCTGRQHEKWRRLGPDPDWLFNVLTEWNKCVDTARCRKLSGRVQKFTLQEVQTNQELLEARRARKSEMQESRFKKEKEIRLREGRKMLERMEEEIRLQDPEYRQWLDEYLKEQGGSREADDPGPLEIARENIRDQANALRSELPRYFGRFNGPSKLGGSGKPMFKPWRLR